MGELYCLRLFKEDENGEMVQVPFGRDGEIMELRKEGFFILGVNQYEVDGHVTAACTNAILGIEPRTLGEVLFDNEIVRTSIAIAMAHRKPADLLDTLKGIMDSGKAQKEAKDE